jgi:hypothetical protein
MSWNSVQWFSTCHIRTDRQRDGQTDKAKIIDERLQNYVAKAVKRRILLRVGETASKVES